MAELEATLSEVQVEQKSYQMPPQEGFTVAYFLTVADIERSTRFYETVFERSRTEQRRQQRRTGVHPTREHLAHYQRRGRPDTRQTNGNPQRLRPRFSQQFYEYSRCRYSGVL